MTVIEPKTSRNGIQVIARAAAILRALKADQSGLSLGQIAETVALPRSTVQRIVGALQTERLVISDASGRGLRLGPEVNALAEATRYNIVERCRLLLSELTQDTGETADLSVMRGAGMIFLDQVPGTHRLRTVSSVGEVFPLTTTANGQACLARLPTVKAERLIRDEWARRGIASDLSEFQNRLAGIAKTGLAFDIDEHTPGISAIGIAFQDLAGDLHAISVPVPSMRFEAVRPVVEAALKTTARHIEAMVMVNA
jgi:DNA-binding IclR family transcriptional regulator